MYGQKEDKTLFFINVPTVLSPSGLVGDHAGAFSGSEESSRGRVSARRPSKCQDCRITGGRPNGNPICERRMR